MNQESSPPQRPDAASLLALAEAGGPKAALAARRAAWLAERQDPALARRALAVATRLEPLDPAPKLALARLAAEHGDIDAAKAEAAAVLKDAIDEAARARAAFMLGEFARIGGDPAGARGYYGQTLRIEENILAAVRDDATAARWYARARGRLAELDASESEFSRARTGAEGALAMLRATAASVGEPPVLAADIADAELRLGALELDDGQPASARRRFGEAIGRYEALAITEKDEPHWRAVLADAWALAAEAEYVRGAHDKAREAMDKALQARLRLAARHNEEAWGLAGTWRLRGALRAALGDAEAAADSYVQARTLAEHLALRAGGAESPNRFLVHTLLDQADLALRTNALNLAREAADAARARAEYAASQGGASPIWLTDAAAAWDRLGEVARIGQAGAQAQDAFARAVEFRRIALDRAPQEKRFKRGLAAALVKLGDAALDAGAHAGAAAALQESAAIRLALHDAEPTPHNAQALAVALERFGMVALARGDKETARVAWEDELALAARIFPENDTLEALRFRGIVEAHLAGLGGHDAESHRVSALACFDVLAQAGALTQAEASLRRKLWGA